MKSFAAVAAAIVTAICMQAPVYGQDRELTEAQRQVMSQIYPTTGFRYLSGYSQELHNHPAMYAFQAPGGQRLVVVGRDFIQSFPIEDWSKAVEAYRQLLVKRGYEPGN